MMNGIMNSSLSSSHTSFTNIYPAHDLIYEGQGRLNQLGGLFINGRPLPSNIRMRIIDMATQGIRPCVISQQLRVSHGCVSKILARYVETGSIEPGSDSNETKMKIFLANVERRVNECKIYQSNTPKFAWEIHERLIQDSADKPQALPSLNNLKRMVDGNNSKELKDESKNPNRTIKNRRYRTNFNQNQIRTLEVAFKETQYPDSRTRENLSRDTSLSDARIQVWFSNRRARGRRIASMHQQPLLLPSNTSHSLIVPCEKNTSNNLAISFPFNPYYLQTNESAYIVNSNSTDNLFAHRQSPFYTHYSNDYQQIFRLTPTFTYPPVNLSGPIFSSSTAATSSFSLPSYTK